ncbi:WD40-repeat-containing domain protein [Pavlovales sp. CCMP2436]|nr:WD40-repeat-containing domain protein [Pavlovales sp. CCMP2436]
MASAGASVSRLRGPDAGGQAWSHRRTLGIALALLLTPGCEGFRGGGVVRRRAPGPLSSVVALSMGDSELFAALRERRSQLSDEGSARSLRWREGNCRTTISFICDDWVRRLAMGDWPLAAMGTASGHVIVGDLDTGATLAMATLVHPDYLDSTSSSMAVLSEHDGGGVTAIDMRGRTVVSGGRDGHARVWRFESDPTAAASGGVGGSAGFKLREMAALPCGGVISALVLTEAGAVWAAALDGSLRRFDPPTEQAEAAATRGVGVGVGAWIPGLALALAAAPLCAAVDEARDLVACGLADGSVALLVASNGTMIARWNAHGGSRARSVAFAHDSVWSGGADGTVRRRFLNAAVLSPGGGASAFDASRPIESLGPAHDGAVVGLVGRSDGLLVSGALDGSLRVWDVAPVEGSPKCLYGLLGYKVWLGSVATDDVRLIADGSDNCIIVHDFNFDAQGDLDEEEESNEDIDEDELDEDSLGIDSFLP